MESHEGPEDIVHPEVRAHINSLVSALGGIGADDDGRYQLGDDALEVLRDIKRWIRFYDEKTNRMDVARCLQQANLIEGDLLPILALWPENASDSKLKSRIALACIEIMVPLTWPMEYDKERTTINHHRHMPVLQIAQVAYKRAIINFDGARILHTAVRTALPAMAMAIGDRTARDQGVIKLVLFFLRNVAMISPPPNAKYDGDETQISRSATIDAFSYQDIFLVLLTLASNMGDDFRTEDVTVMEIIYHLVKRVDPEKLFMNEQQLNKTKANELSSMMNKETAMLQSHSRKGATRHSRFGAMVWVKREGGKMTSVSGADAFSDPLTRDQKIDGSKKFRPPRRARREEKDEKDLGPPTSLNARANKQLRSFVTDFLDSAFNPLFQHVRKTIEREAPHYLHYHRRQFFYLVAWFLEAERCRRKSEAASSTGTTDKVSSFNLVAGVLTQEMFITLTKTLHEAYDMKDWGELTAAMRCFTQILLTVQEMTVSRSEEDQEIAENVLSRLFYEETTHDLIANIIRSYKAQSFDYLDAATELVHHFLRILEAYSKQNIDMQVRSRKRTRKKKKDARKAAATEGSENAEEENDESGNDEVEAERTTKERKFNFQQFTQRFTPQGAVDTFVAFTKYYQELNESQLKRAHRYFYRLAFKQDMSVMLFRVDIVQLLFTMIKGPGALDKSNAMFKDWEELVKQILRRCFKKIEERPELLVEMLFSKMQSVAFFLEHGYEKQTLAKKSQAKPGAELVFKYTEDRDKQIAIAVSALLDKNHGDHVAWVKKVLESAESERRAWAAAQEAMDSTSTPQEDTAEGDVSAAAAKTAPPFGKNLSSFFFRSPSLTYIAVPSDNEERQQAVFKDPYLRLLMRLSDFELVGAASEEHPESLWNIPGEITAEQLKDTLHYINQAEFSPPTFDEGITAADQLKRKLAPRKKADFDDDGEDEEDADDAALFEPGGPTARKVVDEDARRKPKKSRRRRGSAPMELDDSVLEERARKKREREREKAMKIKSAMYVQEGDDEFDSDEDEAFFARERAIAAQAAQAATSGVSTVPKKAPTKKRALQVLSDDDDDAESLVSSASSNKALSDASDTEDTPVDVVSGSEKKKRRRLMVPDDDEEDQDMEGQVSGDAASDSDASAAVASKNTAAKAIEVEDEDEEMASPVLVKRPRVRGGFVMDSDDDE